MSAVDEKTTRAEYIDKDLEKVGWYKKYIKEEVNTIASNFKTKDYVLSKGKDDNSGRFMDYLLLAEDNSPLAIIEAKKFSASPDKGKSQVRTYLADIEKQIGVRLPYFLTNGHNWIFFDQDGIERPVSGPFSQSDLHRRSELYRKRRDPSRIAINRIVDRPKSVLIVKQLMEHIQRGHRSALVSMATGTGKTRVAMAVIDVLMRANYVGNVLFIADRIELANQAKTEGFQKYFNEPVVDLRDDPESFPKGLYVTTIQTLRNGKKSKCYEKFSAGFFDLIIFDEAHRALYDPNQEIRRYFDAIRIGLTATPSKNEEKNTYEYFNCIDNKPTVEYTYDEAVRDDVLVPYTAIMIDTKILSLGIEGATLSSVLQTQLIKQESDPVNTKLSGASFAKVFMDDKTNEVVVREFLNRCYRSDEGNPAKTIFFCVNIAHAKHLKKVFDRLEPKLSLEVREILSDEYRYIDELRRFKLDSGPRIALSVGVLDTGVDIPEVCNLVFVKPVFSEIRFIQMMGRGTRNLIACKNKEWLPNREKKEFLILDFNIGNHSNIEFHKLKKSKESKVGTDPLTKIFLNRVELLKKNLDPKQKEFVEKIIIDELEALNKESFIVREKLPIIEKVVLKKFDLKNFIEDLKNEIAPLIALNPGKNSLVTSFILQVEKLYKHIIDEDNEAIFEIRSEVQEKMENILQKDHLESVQSKRSSVLIIFQEDFWSKLTFDNVTFIVKELAPLMKYYETNPKKLIHIDAPDIMIREEVAAYESKGDEELREFLEKHPIARKITREGVTSAELFELEKQIKQLRPHITIENIEKFKKIDFLTFILNIIGLKQEYDPKVLIEREFDKHIIEGSHEYNSEQIKFLRILKKVFARTKHIDIKDFTIPPLSNERPLDKFQTSELHEIVTECNKIKMK